MSRTYDIIRTYSNDNISVVSIYYHNVKDVFQIGSNKLVYLC